MSSVSEIGNTDANLDGDRGVDQANDRCWDSYEISVPPVGSAGKTGVSVLVGASECQQKENFRVRVP